MTRRSPHLWTAHEINWLRDQTHRTAEEIAAELSLSKKQVETARWRYDAPPIHSRRGAHRSVWTDQQLDWLEKQGGRPAAEVALECGRSPRAIAMARHKYGFAFSWKRARFTKDQLRTAPAKVWLERQNGRSAVEVAMELGVHPSTVHRLRKDFGFHGPKSTTLPGQNPGPRGVYREEHYVWLAAQAALSNAELAKLTGRSEVAIKQVRKNANLPRPGKY